MTSTQTTQQISLTGSLLSITIFQQRLMKNFYIINSKLKRLDQLNDLDARIRGLQKQNKFTNMKLDTVIQKLPKDGGSLNRNDIKIIVKDQVGEMFNNSDDKISKSNFIENFKKNIVEEVGKGNGKRASNSNIANNNSNIMDPQKSDIQQNKLSLTAAQILMSQNKKIPRQSLQECLDNNQMNIVNDIIRGDTPYNAIDQINDRIEDLYRKLEEVKFSRGFDNLAERQAERFEKYEQYEKKSQNKKRKQAKQIKLQGVRKQNVKGEVLKNDLYSQMQKAQLVRNQLSRQGTNRKTFFSKGSTQSNMRDQMMMRRTQHNMNNVKIVQDTEEMKMKKYKSVRKLDKIQRRLKVDDIKQLNSVLREIQLRIQGKVSHEIFMGFIQDFEQKLEIIKITKDPTNELSELRKMVNSCQNKLQSIITFLQQTMTEDDALLVKKQWTCVSCDKNLQKYAGKVGQHLNWQTLNTKKLSPTKAGAFGQTAQLANKVKNLLQIQKSSQ